MLLDASLFRELLTEAEQSERKRSHRNLHQSLEEPVQRLCIGLTRGTYVRPHCHTRIQKGELLLALKGSVGVVTFDDAGRLHERFELSPDGPLSGMEISPDTWHTLFPLSAGAVIMEVKEGPYAPSQEADFAPWAPREGEAEVPDFLRWVAEAAVGQRFGHRTEAP